MSSVLASSSARTRRMTAIGLVANVVLGLVKLLAGIVGHSGALIADAIESLADIAGSIVIWSGLAIGAIPADEDHPYGHGKAEALAGLGVAMLVFAAGLGIAVKAVHDIWTPHENPAWFTLAVLIVVFPIKYGLYLRARRVAKEEGSGALAVDAGHHVADAITSLAACVGITIALFGRKWFTQTTLRWETADDWAALFASGIIVINAIGLSRGPMRELMDTETPEDQERVLGPAREIARGVAGVREIEKMHARKAGAAYWLDMHVQVDPLLAVREAHAIGGKVRADIRSKMANVADVLVHIEPHEPMNP